MVASSISVGDIVAGKFRVERIVAEGGMGLVVAATHLQLERPVALKFLRADVSLRADALVRFTREARAAAKLTSEHVARLLDAGVTQHGMPYMVLEFLEGESLAGVLRKHGAMDIASATEYAIQTCEGLAEAHAHGIVHRDIKPDNLFLVERAPGWRIIKILDFGISKYPLADSNGVTTRVIMGTPCYMSPEQLRSTATVDHRCDIWSLGATLYELLAGKDAFDASQTLPDLIECILTKPAPPLRKFRPEIPEALDAVVLRCLEKNPADRFASAAELAWALLPFAPERASEPAERAASMTPGFDITTLRAVPRTPAPLPPAAQSMPSEAPVAPMLSSPPEAEALPRPSRWSALKPRAIGAAAALALLAALLLSRSPPPNPSQPVAVAAGAKPTLHAALITSNAAEIGAPVTPPPTITVNDVPAAQTPVVSAPAIAKLAVANGAAATSVPAAAPARAWAPVAIQSARTTPAQPTPEKPVTLAQSSEVDPAGGRHPLRPIETRNPYESP